MLRHVRLRSVVGALASVLVAGVSCGASAGASGDFRDDWALEEGFSLEVDAAGFELPTAIAFVRNPGPNAKDPLYFVAELRGTVRVVTNDRTVFEFADLGLREPPDRYPDLGAQNGAAGICLDDERGSVFVTYAAFDERGVLRNGIARLSSSPGTFGLRATARREVGRALAPYPTAANHQVGGCQVVGDAVYVGVGDGTVSARAQNLDQLSGKILRISVDGEPYEGNPFGAGSSRPRAYVWASGLRNPFGLVAVGDELYATQNGVSIDSFLRIERGRNYGWDGTDASIATNAEAVFMPTLAPVHVAYHAGGSPFPPEWAGTFFFGSAQSDGARGAGVHALRYDLEARRVVSSASPFVRFRRGSGGEVAAVALGPDGLYFAGILPNPALGATPVYRVVYEPDAAYPHPLALDTSGSVLYQRFGCASCHVLDNVGGTVGPSLDQPALGERVATRLASSEYRDRVEELAALRTPPFPAYRDARRAILDAEGDRQLELWIENRILEPRFDDPTAAMPNLGLTRAQAAAVTDFLLHGELEAPAAGPERGRGERVRDVLTSKRFAAGVAAGLLGAAVLVLVAWLVRRRPRPSASP
jgi:glucose/arabinose dehydrogenase